MVCYGDKFIFYFVLGVCVFVAVEINCELKDYFQFGGDGHGGRYNM
jgi:hypothetical protein